jgi:hypothetical protein
MKRLLFGLMLVASTAGCDRQPTVEIFYDWVPVLGVTGNTPLQVSWSTYSSRERLVVRDAEHWAAVWPQISSDPLPAVDFATSIVLVAAMGTQPTGGFSIQFGSAIIPGGTSTLEINIAELTPGADCVVTQATTRPTVVALIPRRPETIEFSNASYDRSCK